VNEISLEGFDTEDKTLIIDEIMIKYGQDILHLVFSYVKNKALAEDLTQDIFVKCYNSLHTYNKKSKLRTWLWRIAINHCKDYIKSWYNKNVIVIDEQIHTTFKQTENVEETVIQKDEDEQLTSAVMNLPIKYREVIFLFYYEELSIKEIAEITEIKENTVKTRLRRAKEILREELEDK
jgi:RNA polymerase sigma-70 factor, ECF subfamily